jgi:hypothetical protein
MERCCTQVARMTSAAEMAAVAKQAEDYIWSSVKLAYDRVFLFCFGDYATQLLDSFYSILFYSISSAKQN